MQIAHKKDIPEELVVDILKISNLGYGIAKLDGYVIFVENACPGDKVKIKVGKKNKNFAPWFSCKPWGIMLYYILIGIHSYLLHKHSEFFRRSEAVMAHTIRYFYTSHVGRVRKENQDNFYCNGDYLHHENDGTGKILQGEISTNKNPIFAIFDGMGGEECGEMASYLAAKEMAEFSFDKGLEKDFFDFCSNANPNEFRRI